MFLFSPVYSFADEQIIPPNCRVGFMYDNVHQDPSIYPDPEKFDPDRFSPEKSAINAQNFMGFGVGHRACIGKLLNSTHTPKR